MQLKLLWQYGSSDPDNGNTFATISQWITNLNGKDITWRQRLVSPAIPAAELDWELQRFDEQYVVIQPEMRGITLYWRKPDNNQERSLTVQKLELDTLRQQLYLYPQAQPDVVIRIGLPQVVYQKLSLKNPDWQLVTAGTSYALIAKDAAQQVEVQILMTAENLQVLQQQLSGG